MNLSTTYYSLKSIIHAMHEHERHKTIEYLEKTYFPIAQLLQNFIGFMATSETLKTLEKQLIEEKNILTENLESFVEISMGKDREELISATNLILRMVT